MYAVETGIPLPPPKGPRGPKSIYPWDELKIGQSFFAPGKKLMTMAGYASARAHRTGRKYKVRELDGGVRVWRVA